ncbi:hypothetical protein D3C73_1537920 [compost metagenome]
MAWYFAGCSIRMYSTLGKAITSGRMVLSAVSPLSGTQAVVKPAPLCKQAIDDSKAAPMVLVLPAIMSACP